MIMDETYVYLIAHASKDGRLVAPVKVGFSMSPEKRLRSLQTGNPSSLAMVFSFVTPSVALAKQAEATFHSVCSAERLAGEWFDLDPKPALATLAKVMLGCIGLDLGPNNTHLPTVLEWCGFDRAVEVFASLPDEVAK